jgi:biotin synthase
MPSVTNMHDLIDKGLEGNGLDDQEAAALYSVDPQSKEGYMLQWAGRELQKRASNGMAEIHAQIGLNGSPCPKNCQFCSFAACNGVRHGKLEMPKADVLEYAKRYVDEGANAILLLCTASYRFERLLEMGSAVREVLDPKMPLLANTGDMTLEMAQQVKDAGFNGCYHAVRMGEGVVTSLDPKTRLETFKNIHAAGLSLSTCVEPVGPEHSVAEIVEKTRICIDSQAQSAGVGRRIGVPGTALYAHGEINSITMGMYVAVYRLVSGLYPRLNCAAGSEIPTAAGANLGWAEVGTNPRDTEERTEKGGKGADIAFMRQQFARTGWEVLEGPSPGWILDE